ncbi:5'/3'-nucleotidase SurE [Euzebyella marina]|uniref:5'-nucleotidase SurE n=3 Tax=Bacteroidota TaxID=976 RepID=A0A3G2L5L3_9FLAO|nr:5'/3'-nucleotidase SurE [Euzebyella marina]AYN67564.1 5'/3'-nucleotidase SurE [Euzebyella marina]MAU70532.1 5'/3'-nucleotidase SurE [Pseudozobellia sp.]MBG48020.1 5'/3'-nucleotidase SurE [Pseudozobellia sp.]|tara:strand:+ start:3008 stop:3739 length:732 start_codon:yes stop_codon:yes gene_type:complete
MKILVTNDDGIYSPGIFSLAQVAAEFGEVLVMAPDVEQSSMGQAITSGRPITYKKSPIHFEGIEAYRVAGTPADCVALGLHLFESIDLVLSGINIGANLGNSAWHSGTLSAARQAVLFGVRGIALSVSVGNDEPDFTLLEPFVKKALNEVITEEHKLLNINFPQHPTGDIDWTSQSVRQYDGRILANENPMGKEHFWFTVVPIEPEERDSDRWAVKHGKTSITPMVLNLTDQNYLNKKHVKNS